MSKKNSRRDFIGKLIIGAGTLGALPLMAGSKSDSDDDEKKHAVKNIKALGFQWETADPFLFCVHHEDKYPQGNEEMGPDASLEGRNIGQDFLIKDGWRMYHGSTIPGFPGHPHRGFETVTVVREGLIDHADSMGASGRYGNGDVQWMTAGKGVQHSEMFPCIHMDKPNHLELFQIWLNLPKKSKMVEPHFKMLWSDSIPIITSEDGKAVIEVLAGNLGEHKAPTAPPDSWAADEDHHVAIYNIQLEKESNYTLPATEAGVNRTIYFYKGDTLKINDEELPYYHSAEVDPTQELILENGTEDAKILVLQGKPIEEPVVQHGPFVMNTRAEIHQAFEDYQNTRFGGWPWPRYDQVHDRSLGRFAKHADGKEEIKES